MANRYANLDGTKKIKDEFGKVNTGFDNVQAEVDAHLADTVQQAGGVHGLEITSGVFSPVIAGATTPGANTYSVQHGSYYLIGKLIHCDIRLALSAKDGAMAGAVSITNLPKVSKNTTNKYVAATISRITNITLTASDNNLVATILPNLSAISLQQVGSAKVVANLDSTAISGNTEIVISVEYEIN